MKFKSINLKYIQLFPSAPHFSSCTFIFSSFLHFFPFSFFFLKLSFPFPFFPVLVCSTRVSACYHYVPGLVFARLSYWRSSGHFYHQWKKRYWKKTFNLSTLFLHFHIFFPIGFFSPLSSAVCFFFMFPFMPHHCQLSQMVCFVGMTFLVYAFPWCFSPSTLCCSVRYRFLFILRSV